MCKKLFLTGLAVVGGLFLLAKTDAGSYVRLWAGKAKDSCRNQVSPEMEIERLRAELNRRNNEMKKQFTAIAEEMVAIDTLRKEVSITKTNLKNRYDEMAMLKEDLKSDAKVLVYAGREVQASRVREKLAKDLESYKQADKALKSKEKLLEAKEASLQNAHQQIGEMRSQYEQIEVELAQLETALKEVRLAQTRSKFQLDDSHLARIKESKNRLENRINAMKYKHTLEGQFGNDLDINVKNAVKAVDVVKDFEEYFEKSDKVAVEK